MRGEDAEPRYPFPVIRGSPPHARGRHREVSKTRFAQWITPACAGKTRRSPPQYCLHSDHPRMRGEDPKPTLRSTMFAGSPPHARGRRIPTIMRLIPMGITPACAGKTRVRREKTPSRTDHPRMRGEDLFEITV